ncbi:MAG: PAS domain S-box-containing protein [Limisphaerales bacterium]|jgi:PAS domain S-box-containing protein
MDLQETHIRDLLDSAPDATVIVDKNGQIVFANSQVETLFGYAREALVGSQVETLMPERYRPTHDAHRMGFVNSPQVRPMGSNLSLYGQRQDGSEFPIEISLSPVKTDAGLLISSAIRDVSERKMFESVLQNAKEAAEQAAATKSRFLAAASHDLRQPLQSIALYLSVLNKYVREKPDKALEVSAKISKSLGVMSELLDALLDISKLDAGAIEPEKRDFEVQTLFDALVVDNAPAAAEKDLTFIVEPTDAVAHSDPALLQRILENFVTNAIRYTDAGSVHVSCGLDGDQLKLQVRDSGIGIPEEAIDTIFEEYFQLDNPVRDRRRGLGLGLSIVKYISTLLDNPLEVVSVISEGSTFSVNVPIGRPIEVVSTVAPPKAASIRDEQPVILFVDDDPAIVDATTMMLEIAGIKVEAALDGDAAIVLLNEGLKPDVVVSDYRLPGANGVEVIRYARMLMPEVPTVLMTGDTSGHAIEQAKLSNCTVLHKPVDTDRLIGIIDLALSSKTQAEAL